MRRTFGNSCLMLRTSAHPNALSVLQSELESSCPSRCLSWKYLRPNTNPHHRETSSLILFRTSAFVFKFVCFQGLRITKGRLSFQLKRVGVVSSLFYTHKYEDAFLVLILSFGILCWHQLVQSGFSS